MVDEDDAKKKVFNMKQTNKQEKAINSKAKYFVFVNTK